MGLTESHWKGLYLLLEVGNRYVWHNLGHKENTSGTERDARGAVTKPEALTLGKHLRQQGLHPAQARREQEQEEEREGEPPPGAGQGAGGRGSAPWPAPHGPARQQAD